MWRGVTVLIISGVIVVAPAAAAQAARIGRLPVLGVLPAEGGVCRTDPGNAALVRIGIVHIVNFTYANSDAHRFMSIGTRASGDPVMLIAMMSTQQARRGEGESISVFFDARGNVLRGRRSAYTSGTPARVSEDRHAPLLPADTAAARLLVRALRQRCHV